MRRLLTSFSVVLLTLTAGMSQVQPKALSNDDVIQMITLGLSDELIVEKIKSASSTSFDTSIDALKALKAAKVSDTVLRAMINPHSVAVGSMALPLESVSHN
jgi:hypothetical protein